jgi:hypothetical protein
LTPDDFRDVARDSGAFLHRVFGLRIARGAARIRERAHSGTQSLSWKIPLAPAGSDATHEIVFVDDGAHIVAVDGTRWTARGAQRALVERPLAGSAASVTVRTSVAGKFEAGVPPLPLELREGEVDVLRHMLPLDRDG